MSATDELRRLLDERGVEWADQFGPFPVTAYEGNGVTWIAKEYAVGKFSIETRPVTPEQAVAATLWAGEALNTVAEKWAEAKVEAEDYAKRNMLLESLVRDWYELYEEPDYGDYCRLMHRMRELEIEVDA